MNTRHTIFTGISSYQWRLFVICFLACAFAGVISTLMPVYLPVVVHDLLGQTQEESLHHIGAYINSIFVFGAAFGGLLAGYVCDRFGRKKAVIISILAYALPALFIVWITGWPAVLVCRFASGMGMGAVLVATTTLLLEEWPSSSRSFFIGIFSVAIPVGILSAGAIDYWVENWRQAFGISVLPLALALGCTRWLQESVAWKNRLTATVAITQNEAASWSGYYRLLFLGATIFGTMLIGLWAIFLWLPSWIQELAQPEMAQQARGMSMILLGGGGIIGGLLTGVLTHMLGLRRSLIVCFLICLLMSLLLFTTHQTISVRLYIELLLLALAFGASQGVLSEFIPSLFPVSIRGRATGISFNAGRILTAIAVLFVGILVKTLGGYGASLLCFSVVFVIGGITTLLSQKQINKAQRHGTYNVEQ